MLMLMMKSYQKTCGAFLQWPCLGEPEVGDGGDVGDDDYDDDDDYDGEVINSSTVASSEV